MAVSAAAMVAYIDEAIAALVTGGVVRAQSPMPGVSVEHFDLDQLRRLRSEYAAIAAQEQTGGNRALVRPVRS